MTFGAYSLLSLFLFLSGMVIVLYRKSVVAIFIGIELLLNASALSFLSYAKFVPQPFEAHIFALFIIVVAAAEAAVGLAVAIRFFQLKESIHIDDATELQN
jgi:NADH-quinone oxidoreductase subunit K